jgi:hypothetical protein
MPDKDAIHALKGALDAFIQVFQTLGPGWTLVYTLVAVALVVGLLYWRGRQTDKAWERALAAKDDMIVQINEQNRELRVQALVVGKQFTKEEAVRLVYGKNRLSDAEEP